jgi:putative ATP-binding cassette transporter
VQLIHALFRRSPRQIVMLGLLGLLSGVSSAGLIATVERLLRTDTLELWLVLLFAGTVLIRLLATFGSNLLLVRFAQNTVLELSRDLVTRLLRTPFRRLEEIGGNRVIAVMTDDVAVLSTAIVALPSLTVNAAVLLGCAAYLGWLSPMALVLLLVVGALAALLYSRFLRRAYEAIRLVRDGRDRLFAAFRSVTDGMKELQLHRARRQAFVRDEVDEITEYLKVHNVRAMQQFAVADAWTQIVFYGVLAVILFGLSTLADVPRTTTSAYVFAALYCMAPVWGLVATAPSFERGHAAWERISQLGLSLDRPDAANDEGNAALVPTTPPVIRFESVQFSYQPGAETDFTLGPLDFVLHPGELTFVVGGNGSGKSTLVKLLTGLYEPTAGRVLVNGQPVLAENRDDYRELFSAVFSDFYLFERLHGFTTSQLQSDAPRYLEALGLTQKVTISDGRLSTTQLSTGQRRRLALVNAYLENRPVYVLDEWAADQDPQYRATFYTSLLPELRRRGKTVVVITHDDRYFHLADRVLKLDFGRIVDAATSGPPGHGRAARETDTRDASGDVLTALP